MAVSRHITGTAHQGGNFTAGKIPTTPPHVLKIHLDIIIIIIIIITTTATEQHYIVRLLEIYDTF